MSFTEDPERPNPAPADRPRRALAMAAVMAAALLAAGCGLLPGTGGGSASGPGRGEDVGSADGADAGGMPRTVGPTSLGEDTTLQVASVERADNDTTVVKFSITNKRTKPVSIFHALIHGYGDQRSVGGVSVIDVGEQKQYLPIRYGKKSSAGQDCYCSTFKEFDDKTDIPAGKTVEFWAGYPALPDDVRTVSVHTPVTGALHDVPVTAGGKPPEPLPDDHDDPVVLDLVASRESTEDGSSRSESSEQVSVALSTDVLFDVDKSELRPDAEAELKKVAAEVESSGTAKVQIDGHTDDTGTDRINEPLSEDRAKAVEKRLKDLVGADGITYTAKGHGSDEPVAENDTKEDRQKNRRVTVGFDTPEGGAPEPSPSASPSAPAEEPPKEGGYGTADIAEGEESMYFHSLQVRVDSVDRSSAGGFATLRYTVLNSAGKESAILAGELGGVAHCGGVGDGRLNGAVLTDDANALSYPVVFYPDEDCLAPRGNGVSVRAKDGLTLWQGFWLDPTTTEVTVEVPPFDPVKGVPVI